MPRGGSILRDLFTEDGGGWLEDPGLLERLVGDKLARLAEAVRLSEGWKWAEVGADYRDADALEPREDHAAYIGHWLQVLKNDKRFVVSAASHAQKAVDYLKVLQPIAS